LIKQEEEWFSIEEWRLVEEKMWWEGVCRMFVKWKNTGLTNLPDYRGENQDHDDGECSEDAG
jgi:hypothetical protein